MYDVSERILSKVVRWGAIMNETDIRKISDILGKDMLTMEEKENFLNTIQEVNNDKSILDDWLLDELAKHKVRSQIDYAKEQGIEQGIEQGFEQGIEQGTEESKLEIIKNMLIKKLDISIISEVTGKNLEEIKIIETSMLS